MEPDMTDEAEVAAAAPEQTSAPEAQTEETPKTGAAETEQDAKAKDAEGADNQDVEPADAETEDEEGEAEKPKKRTRTSQLREKIREQAMEIEALRRREAERSRDESLTPPREDDFGGDFEAYNRALIAHETAKLLRKERSEDVQRDIETRQQEIRKARLADHLDRVAEVRKVIPDYDKVIESGLNLEVRHPENLDLLMDSDKSELIAYHLAEKPERAREFARMSPIEAAKYIGKLEARLSLPKPKTTTSAPTPVTTPKGAAQPKSQDQVLDDWLKRTYG